MRRAKRFVLNDPIFCTGVLVQLGGTPQELINAYAKRIDVAPWHDGKPAFGTRGRFVAFEPMKNGALWLSDTVTPGIVAHECLHAAWYLLGKRSGMPLDDSSEEAFAYYVQWLVDEIEKRR